MADAPFQTSLDIANRALQHLGAPRIAAFTDDSKQASACAFVYDKVRTAELRRNNWRFSIKWTALRPFDTTTMIVVPAAWSANAAYQPGAIVQDSTGLNWISTTAFNVGKQPGSDPSWDIYFGPMSADPFDTTGTTNYYVGEFVYENVAPGVFNIYSCLKTTTQASVSNPVADPSTPTAWSATMTFAKGQTVLYTDGFYYLSLIDLNLNNIPGTYLVWNSPATYAQNDTVAGSDGNLYVSQINGNTGHNPVGDDGSHWLASGGVLPWTTDFTGSLAGNGWIKQAASLVSPNIIYPLGSGPSSETFNRNVYRLPNGFLRRAVQDPKAGVVAWLGGPVGNIPDDWLLEGNYFTSSQSTPIVLRFSADITLVTAMDPMFCEGLAARMAMEMCEELTQSGDKLMKIEGLYKRFMDEARTVNGIEVGATEAFEDEFISVRI